MRSNSEPAAPDLETPAALVVRLFSGVRGAARALGRDPATIHRWLKDGGISSRVQGQVLDLAEALGEPVEADQLIWPPHRSWRARASRKSRRPA